MLLHEIRLGTDNLFHLLCFPVYQPSFYSDDICYSLSRFVCSARSLEPQYSQFVRGYYRWRKNQPTESSCPVFFDFTGFEPLRKSEELFYEVGLAPCQAISLLKNHLANIE